jgi:hypothetical protein
MTTLDAAARRRKRRREVHSFGRQWDVSRRGEVSEQRVLARDNAAKGVDLILKHRVILAERAHLRSDLHHRLGDVRLGARIAAGAEQYTDEQYTDEQHTNRSHVASTEGEL